MRSGTWCVGVLWVAVAWAVGCSSSDEEPSEKTGTVVADAGGTLNDTNAEDTASLGQDDASSRVQDDTSTDDDAAESDAESPEEDTAEAPEGESLMAFVQCGLNDTWASDYQPGIFCRYGGYCTTRFDEDGKPYAHVECCPGDVPCCDEAEEPNCCDGLECDAEEMGALGVMPPPREVDWVVNASQPDPTQPCHEIGISVRTYNLGKSKPKPQYAQMRMIDREGNPCPVAEMRLNIESWAEEDDFGGVPTVFGYDTHSVDMVAPQDDGKLRQVHCEYMDASICPGGHEDNPDACEGAFVWPGTLPPWLK